METGPGPESVIDLKTLIAALSAFVAVLSATVSIYFNWRSQKAAKISLKIAVFNARQSERARLLAWAQEGMNSLSRAYVYFLNDSSIEKRAAERSDTLIALTSAIDKGRWHLPNYDHETYGKNKESAYIPG